MSEAAGLQTQRTKPQPGNSYSLFVQRKCACGGSAGLTGSCTECERKKLLGQPLQTKLRINEPGDQYEQEADRVAEQVMRMDDSKVNANNSSPRGGRLVQRRVVDGNTGIGEVSLIVQEALSTPGRPLDPATRAFFEARFGHDFGNVRVHMDAKAAKSAEAVSSHAFTVRHDIVMGTQEYAPSTADGRRLLAHELAHVIQQSGGSHTENIIQRQEKVNLGEADRALANTALLNTGLLEKFIVKRQTEKGIKLEGRAEVVDPEEFESRYINYLMRPGDPAGPRRNPKTDTLYNYAEAAKQAESIGGFADGVKIVLKYREDSAVMLHDAIHEAIHQQATVSGYKALGYNANEGTTEFLTRYVCRDRGLNCGSGEYQAQYQAVTEFMQVVGLDPEILAYAYFSIGSAALEAAVGAEVLEAWKKGMKKGEGTTAAALVRRAIKKYGLPGPTGLQDTP